MLAFHPRNLAKAALAAAVSLPLAAQSAFAVDQETIDRINHYIQKLAYPGADKLRDPEYRKGIRRVIVPGKYGAEDRSIIIDTNAQVSLSVQFAFDSAKLDKKSKKVLWELAEALNSDYLDSTNYFIGGHTDARGSDAYNLRLSKNRASNVQSYIVSEPGVKPHRLFAAGFGESVLKDEYAPASGVNRRVEVSVILHDIDFEPYHTDYIPEDGVIESGYNPDTYGYSAQEGSTSTPPPPAPEENNSGTTDEDTSSGVEVPEASAPESGESSASDDSGSSQEDTADAPESGTSDESGTSTDEGTAEAPETTEAEQPEVVETPQPETETQQPEVVEAPQPEAESETPSTETGQSESASGTSGDESVNTLINQ